MKNSWIETSQIRHSAKRASTLFSPSRIAIATAMCAALLSLSSMAQELSVPCDETEEKALATAKKDEVKRITAFTPAVTIDRVNPRYPKMAARRGREGWVRVSYVIDEQGNVKDPVIDDYFGSSAFKRSALSAVEQWKFEPAMKDGKPTQQCHQLVQMDFKMGGQTGARRKFIIAYKEADEIFRSGDIEAADQAVEALHAWDSLNRYENTWLLSLDAQIANALKDEKREAKSLSRVLSSNGSKQHNDMVFSEDYIANVYQRMIVLDAQRGQYADALASFESLKNMEEQQARVDEIMPVVSQIKEHIASDQHLQLTAELNQRGAWFHTLVRNKFAFNNIQGDLDTVEVRCETHREKFSVAEDHIWSIPESWGQCRVLVKGDDTATFDLIEVAES